MTDMTQEQGSGEPGFSGPIRIRGDQLDLARRACGWSQAELARRAKISEGHVSRVINGQGGVSIEVMADLLDAFGNRLKLRELAVIPPGNNAGDLTGIGHHRQTATRTVGPPE